MLLTILLSLLAVALAAAAMELVDSKKEEKIMENYCKVECR